MMQKDVFFWTSICFGGWEVKRAKIDCGFVFLSETYKKRRTNWRRKEWWGERIIKGQKVKRKRKRIRWGQWVRFKLWALSINKFPLSFSLSFFLNNRLTTPKFQILDKVIDNADYVSDLIWDEERIKALFIIVLACICVYLRWHFLFWFFVMF